MNGLKIDDLINYYQGSKSEDLFHNLSDMEEFHRGFQLEIESGGLCFSPIPGVNDLFIMCMLNAFCGYFDSIVFFRMSLSGDVEALMVLKKNRIVANNQFVFSIGYSVNKELRGQGLGRWIVDQAKVHARSFFDNFGPHYDLEPHESYKYILESVVAIGNAASNRLASRLLHSGEPILTGREARTDELSNVYRFAL